ncbi:MAG: radical SAM protein [Armatimonadota bacterium]
MDAWKIEEKYKKIIKKETALYEIKKNADLSAVLIYPNTYYVGMSNLGFQTVFSIINSSPNFNCERAFLPDSKDEQIYKQGTQKYYSMESARLISDFDMVIFSVSYEVDYLNVLKMLHYSGIPLKSEERDEKHPIIIAGGAAVTLNPQPISKFIDLFIIGDGENTVEKMLNVRAESKTKDEFLKNISLMETYYVPKYYSNDKKIIRNCIKKIKNPAHSIFLSPDTEFKNTFLVEATRGCPYKCSFCVVGNCFNPFRYADISGMEKIIKYGRRFTDRIGIISSSVNSYPYIKELIHILDETGFKVSFSSLRADLLDEDLLKLLLKSSQRTLTIAPETISGKLRKIINKNIDEEDIYNAFDLCIKHNLRNYKLYFMLGLPSEDEADIEEMIAFLKKLSSYLYERSPVSKIKVSVSKFIPKPFTPLQWERTESEDIYNHKIQIIKEALKKINNIELNFESGKIAYISSLLSRGDSDIADALCNNFLDFKYRRFFEETKNLDFESKFNGKYNEILPWGFLCDKDLKEKLWAKEKNF